MDYVIDGTDSHVSAWLNSSGRIGRLHVVLDPAPTVLLAHNKEPASEIDRIVYAGPAGEADNVMVEVMTATSSDDRVRLVSGPFQIPRAHRPSRSNGPPSSSSMRANRGRPTVT